MRHGLLGIFSGLLQAGSNKTPTCSTDDECTYCGACECNEFRHGTNCFSMLGRLGLSELAPFWKDGYVCKEVKAFPSHAAYIVYGMGQACRGLPEARAANRIEQHAVA